MPGTMFCMCSVGFFSRPGVAHCFLCDLLSFCYVSVSVTFWYVLSVIVCHVCVLYVLCFVLCYVSASRTVLYFLLLTFCHVSALHTVLYVFC